MLIAVNYHYVRPVFDAPYPGIHGITPGQFESQLKLLADAGTFVSAADLLAAVRGDDHLPERALIVTFDDGLREQYDHAVPILRRLNIPAIFFVNTRPIADGTVSSVHKIHLLRGQVPPQEFVERLQACARERGIGLDVNADCQAGIAHYKYDDPQTARLKYLLNFVLATADRDLLIELMFDQVFGGRERQISRELYMEPAQFGDLDREFCIGTHAHEHLPLGLLSDAAAEQQIEQSAVQLRQWTGQRPFALSYPYGSREASTVAVARAAARRGIEFAFTTERAGNRELRGPLHLARVDNNDMPGGKKPLWPLESVFAAIPPRTWHTDLQLAGEPK